jgi:hypothetical protein
METYFARNLLEAEDNYLATLIWLKLIKKSIKLAWGHYRRCLAVQNQIDAVIRFKI